MRPALLTLAVLLAVPAVAKDKATLVALSERRNSKLHAPSAVKRRAAHVSNSALKNVATPAESTEAIAPLGDGTEKSASVIPLVTDESGESHLDVEVSIDGQPLVSKLDGRAIPIRPGVHQFSFSAEGGVFATQKLLVADGQQRRLIQVSIPSAPKVAIDAPVLTREVAAETRVTTTGKVLTVTFGVAGAAAVVAGALLTAWGRHDNDALAQCSPWCATSAQQHIKSLYLGADVSFGIGAAAFGVAIASWLFAREAVFKPDQSYLVGVQLTRSGAVASLGKTF